MPVNAPGNVALPMLASMLASGAARL